MSKQPVTPDSPELIRLRQQVQQADIKERQNLLKDFLTSVKSMVADQAKLYLPETLDEIQRLTLTQPQVFLSYAWEIDGTAKYTHLHNFLKYLATNLSSAGLIPWLDLQRMTGDLDKQMRSNIQKSQYVLLIGTDRYAERTKPGSDTNVCKELKFALEEYNKRSVVDDKSADFLLPLMLEGNYGTTFPTVGQYLIRDGRSWSSLETGQWQSFDQYVKDLTQYEPVGILPCLLGLNRLELHLLKYRQACREQYIQKQQALMNALELLRKDQEFTDEKFNSNHLATPLTPALQVLSLESKYEKKEDKESKHLSIGGFSPQFISGLQMESTSVLPMSPAMSSTSSFVNEAKLLSSEAIYKCAKQYHEQKDYVSARRYYEAAWSKGVVKAGVKLAALLIRGQGGGKDETRAITLFTLLAESGDTLAMQNLTQAYRYGVGAAVLKDITKAMYWQKRYEHQIKLSDKDMAIFGKNSQSLSSNPTKRTIPLETGEQLKEFSLD